MSNGAAVNLEERLIKAIHFYTRGSKLPKAIIVTPEQAEYIRVLGDLPKRTEPITFRGIPLWVDHSGQLGGELQLVVPLC